MITISQNSAKKRIIDAALIEFSDKGYKKASTNNIVKQAGVSKGMLFYYFNNKEVLYRYLVDESILSMKTMLNTDNMFESDNFIERCMQLAKAKMSRYIEDPLVFRFAGNVYINDRDVAELSDITGELFELSRKLNVELYKDLDTSPLRKDMDSDKIIKMMQWVISGYQQELISKFEEENLSKMDMEPLWDEFYKFMDMLRTIFYTNE